MDESDPIHRARRRRKAARVRLLAIYGVIGGVCLLGGVAVILFTIGQRTGGPSLSPFAPSATNEGQKWNARELLDYLNKRGMKGMMVPTKGREVFFGFEMKRDDLENAAEIRDLKVIDWQPGLVVVIKFDNPQHARDAAGTTRVPCHFWGCFLLESTDEKVMATIRSHLR